MYTVKSQGSDYASIGRPHSACLHWEGSSPRNTRRCLAGSISGRVKALPTVLRDQGKKGKLWSQGAHAQPPTIWGFPDHSLTSASKVPRDRVTRAEQGGRDQIPPHLLACPVWPQCASAGDLLGLPFGLAGHIQYHVTLTPSWLTHCKLGVMESTGHGTEGVQGSFPSSALNKGAPTNTCIAGVIKMKWSQASPIMRSAWRGVLVETGFSNSGFCSGPHSWPYPPLACNCFGHICSWLGNLYKWVLPLGPSAGHSLTTSSGKSGNWLGMFNLT